MKRLFTILLLLTLSATAALAQAPGPPELIPDAGTNPVSFLNIIVKGGKIMIPLALLSFIGALLVIFYFLTIRRGTVVSDKFMNTADALIRKQDYLGLIAVCHRAHESIARIAFKTLDFATKNPSAGFDEVREVAEAEGSRQSSILQQRISYLNDIGRIAPMVGLLGTVIGMITAFDNMGVGAAQMELAPGVAQALITTASGLVIGIPALVFYSFFRGKVQKLIAELEAAATHLMALLAAQYKRAASRAAARATAMEQQPVADYQSAPAEVPLEARPNDITGI
jgi:biopolymer transport protein ExbB